MGPVGLLSTMDAEDDGRTKVLPWREADSPPSDVSRGDEAKKEDLRWATDELGALSVAAAAFPCEVDSLFVFSASAFIRCEMPDETLIFLGAAVSDFGGGGQPPDTLRAAGCSGEGRERPG